VVCSVRTRTSERTFTTATGHIACATPIRTGDLRKLVYALFLARVQIKVPFSKLPILRKLIFVNAITANHERVYVNLECE
jgi:hypothetical protein